MGELAPPWDHVGGLVMGISGRKHLSPIRTDSAVSFVVAAAQHGSGRVRLPHAGKGRVRVWAAGTER